MRLIYAHFTCQNVPQINKHVFKLGKQVSHNLYFIIHQKIQITHHEITSYVRTTALSCIK